MADEKIVEFIRGSRTAGHDDAHIRQALFVSGETDADIAEAFKALDDPAEAERTAKLKKGDKSNTIFYTLGGGLVGLVAGLFFTVITASGLTFFLVANIFMFGLFGLSIGILRIEGRLNTLFLILIAGLFLTQIVVLVPAIFTPEEREKELSKIEVFIEDKIQEEIEREMSASSTSPRAAKGSVSTPAAPGATDGSKTAPEGAAESPGGGSASSTSSGVISDEELAAFIESEDFMFIFENYGIKDQIIDNYVATMKESEKEKTRASLEEMFSSPAETQRVFKQGIAMDKGMHDLVEQMYRTNIVRKGQ